MNKDLNKGIVIGLNIAIRKLFHKIWKIMKSEVISQHDAIISLSDDIEAIEDLLLKQKAFLEIEENKDGLEECKAIIQEEELENELS